MRKISLLFFLAWLFIAGCRLDPPVYPQNSLVKTEDSYQPSAKGNVWVYQVDFGTHILENKISATGTRQIIAAKTYDVSTATLNGSPAPDIFFTHENGLYSMRQKSESNTDYIEFYYLKEGAVTGETWTYPVNETGMLNNKPARTVSGQINRGLTLTVLGRQFTNVTQTEVKLEYEQNNNYVEFATYDFFVVKGIGIIQINTNISGFASYTSLKSYTGK